MRHPFRACLAHDLGRQGSNRIPPLRILIHMPPKPHQNPLHGNARVVPKYPRIYVSPVFLDAVRIPFSDLIREAIQHILAPRHLRTGLARLLGPVLLGERCQDFVRKQLLLALVYGETDAARRIVRTSRPEDNQRAPANRQYRDPCACPPPVPLQVLQSGTWRVPPVLYSGFLLTRYKRFDQCLIDTK